MEEDSMTERMVATGTAQMSKWHILHTKCILKKTEWKTKMYDFLKSMIKKQQILYSELENKDCHVSNQHIL